VRALVVVALIACRSNAKAPAHDGSNDPAFAMVRAGDGTVQQESPEQALATLRANCDRATRDNHLAVACFSLGQLYDTGTFVEKNPELAMGMHDKACGLGEMRACAELGVFYDDGVVVPRDSGRAKQLFRQACDGGNGRGCNSLILLHPETATRGDIAYVLDRYRAICDGGGDAEACMALGDAYRTGTNVAVDANRAIALLAKACDANHPTACNNLGVMRATGQGGAKDDAAAAKLYAKACSLGSHDGCVNAGIDPATSPLQIKNR